LTNGRGTIGPMRLHASKKPRDLAITGLWIGAGEMNRTPDLLITNELLYRLSYTGLLFLLSLRL
jgi:hypothetical protein